MRNYERFLTESLAHYAQHMVYAYGERYSPSKVAYMINRSWHYINKVMSFYDTAYYYYNSTNENWVGHASLQFIGQGYFFAHTYGYNKLGILMDKLRAYSLVAHKYLMDPNISLAERSFEKCFYLAYGKYANARWIYPGSHYNRAYLYGDFWFLYYQ
jgi:hypothetical protein